MMLFNLQFWYTLIYGASVAISLGLICIPFFPLSRKASWTARYATMLLCTLPTEFAHILLLIKLMCLWEAHSTGMIFRTSLASTSANVARNELGLMLLRVDIVTAMVLWAFFLQSYFMKYVIDDATKQFYSPHHSDPPRLFTISYVLRFLNPFWTARNFLIHRNINYATVDEITAFPDQAKSLELDVYRHSVHGTDKPVLIYLHGGLWQNGDKESVGPFVSYLVLKGWIVVSANYRLSPAIQYPEHLIDVKRVIRWVKTNIVEYGGDANFVAISGDAAGAHLATMAALTPNQPRYQPGFEAVDTSLRAAVVMAGFYDVMDVNKRWTKGFPEWFAHTIGQISEPTRKAELLQSASPLEVLKAYRTLKRRLSVASTRDESELLYYEIRCQSCAKVNIPPFMVLHGIRDLICPIAHVRDFVDSFRKIPGASMTYIELPGANHFAHAVSSPRAHYIAYGIVRFLNKLHEDYSRKKSSLLI